MKFESAEWFLLTPLIAAAAWFWPQLRLLEPRRAACAVLLLLLLAAPLIRRAEDGIDLWLLVDRSSSAATALARDLVETETILNRTKGLSDRLRIVDYATSPVPRESLGVTINPAETRTTLAIRHVMAQLAPERLARILVLTDGFATEPLAGVSETLFKRHIPLDYRLLVPPVAIDFRVDSMEMPPRVRADESFVIEARLIGSKDGAVEYEVTRDGQRIGSGSTELRAGEARVRLIERTRLPGAHRYAVRVISAQDAHPENDSAEMWTEVLAGPRVVLLSAFDHDPVADILRTHAVKVEQVTDLSRLHAGVLSGARLVIFNNVPAHLVSTEFQRALEFYVREQGGGVLMCGGRFSFGSGGWASSPVDALLPVSMELRKEHRKLRVAMAIILDRSGSMAASVSADGKTKSKMDLADEGTAQAISLLGDDDLVSVFAVDSAPHVVARLTPVGPARQRLMDDVLRIQSAGGGIYVYEGLKAGWDELKRADAGQRHLILFSDAADSEQPGEYKTLIAEMTAQGATISVIGLGTEKDSDAELLKDIASRGNGRIFFNANAAELPALFAQETVAVARSAFLEEKTKLAATAGWMQIAASPLPWLGEVDGYNLSYLKPEATTAANGSDEYAAPLVAFWQRGLGRAAAISFPVAGDFSAQARAWPAYGEFVTTLVRWLSGDDAPAGLALTTRLSGTQLDLDLFYGPEWVSKIAGAPPRISVAGGEEQPASTLQWEKMAPGHFRASRSLSPGERLRGAAQIGNIALPFGPIATASNAEWQFRREALLELRTLSRQSGGRERLDLATSWESPPIERFTDIQPWLITALVVMLLLDALLTRLDWWSSDAWAQRTRKRADRAARSAEHD